jgi:hypothetical protein
MVYSCRAVHNPRFDTLLRDSLCSYLCGLHEHRLKLTEYYVIVKTGKLGDLNIQWDWAIQIQTRSIQKPNINSEEGCWSTTSQDWINVDGAFLL